MKELEVLKCQVQEWYPWFKSVCIATEIHRLSEAYVSYLLEDSFFLPSNSDGLPTRLTPEIPQLQAEDYDKWSEEDEEEAVPKSFPDLEENIRASIERLGGAVMPKLNWSAPKDAVWISSSKNLKCKNFGEVSLLLKASDSVVHDLCHAFDNCEDKTMERPVEFVLALRKWYDLRPEMEFRAFVKRGLLVGICQREVTGFYPVLRDRETYRVAIAKFFHVSISGKFGLEDYTFDVYVTKDLRVKLLDFNPWGGSTLPLLFSWEELDGVYRDHVQNPVDIEHMMDKLKVEDDKVELRIVESEGLVQPSLAVTSGVPLDYIDTGPGSAWDEFLRKAEEEIKAQP